MQLRQFRVAVLIARIALLVEDLGELLDRLPLPGSDLTGCSPCLIASSATVSWPLIASIRRASGKCPGSDHTVSMETFTVEDAVDRYHERAGFLEFDCGCTRQEAEFRALDEIIQALQWSRNAVWWERFYRSIDRVGTGEPENA